MKKSVFPLIRIAVALIVPILPLGAQNWTLVWSDEFNGSPAPFTPTSSNNSWWSFDTGTGFGTGEIETMLSDGTTTYLDGNGHLVIKTYKTGSTYYSGRIKTKINAGKGFDFSYGRVEASIQIPSTQGIWPAF
jgi:beta-glucanase (GH16 family)